jgi:hypothetical protein
MAAGLAWLARIPPDSDAWRADLTDPVSLLPSGATLIDVLPGQILLGLGISMVVAPLTTALMSSIPVRNAGLGSAINNAVSRVGSPLVSAVLFIAITATFYPTLGGLVPELDVRDVEVRAQIQPLAAPPEGTDVTIADASRRASTDAFQLAMLVSAGLLLAGATVNAVGIRDQELDGASGRPPPAA